MASVRIGRAKGFTLMEMVTVIVLLGVVSVGVTSFLRLGTQAYVDVTARDELMASARFAVERLNRELRAALPNSARINGQCLEFYPTVASAIYTDAPVAPEAPRNTIDIIRFNDDVVGISPSYYRVAIYPITPNDLYPASTSDRIASVRRIVDLGGNKWQIQLPSSKLFAQDSPTDRLYFIDYSYVSYCVVGDELRRNGIPMAENIETFNFEVLEATHLRNSVITLLLTFNKNDERVTFNNEIQVINVP